MKVACALAAAAFLIPALTPAQSPVRLNQIQVLGTHNSYHAGLEPGIAKVLGQKDPATLNSLDYAHPSLTAQLDGGVRQLELDVFADAKGGRFAHPFGPAVVAQAGLPADSDPYADGRMLRPGFKVMHVQDIDFVSVCQPFTACLEEIRAWSHAHPTHAPLFLLVETKQGRPDQTQPWTATEPITTQALQALDREVRSVFPPSETIAPDQVRGHYATLNQAVRHQGWPTLDAARGKVVFLLDQASATPLYLQAHPGLRGAVFFPNSEPGRAESGFVERNDGPTKEIAHLVRQGYLVRTRADSDTAEARSNRTERRDQALASGAQIVSTDYPAAEPSRWTGYRVALPGGGAVRCNPVTAAASCAEGALEPVLGR
jgi:hypothetical protein